MKKKNLMTLLGIALVVALISTGVFYGLFVTNLKSNGGTGKTLVVTAKAVEAGTVLTAADLTTVAWASDQLPAGAYERVDQAAGKTAFDAMPVGEPVLESRLAGAEGEGRGSGIPVGMRAVSVHVSDSTGVLTLLHPGHKVDVQVLLPKDNGSGAAAVRTALEDLEVLGVAPKPEQSSQGYNLPVVTLLAKPEQADVLALADSGARIRLTLRNPLDDATRTTTPLNLNTVMRAQ